MRPAIYISNFFLGLHYFLIVYVNSSFLSKFIDGALVNLLYSAGSILNIILFLSLPRLLSRLNAKKITITLIFLEFAAVLGLALAQNFWQVSLFFIIQQMLAPTLLYCLDLYLERSLSDENHTGRTRAIFITSLNLSLVISFLTVSLLVKDSSFSPIYLLSAAALIPLVAVISIWFSREVRKPSTTGLFGSIVFISKDKDVLRILISSLLLQLFYAIMVIYLPLLLRTVPGFEWSQIGIIILIMIIPFIITEIPLGWIMDKRSGETEVLKIGFAIMSAATISLAFIESSALAVWAGVLFVSRIGASFVEIANESYFFKKVTDRNASIISLFRITQTLSYVLSPLIALPVLYFTGYQNLFAILGVIVLFGLLVVPKVDTR